MTPNRADVIAALGAAPLLRHALMMAAATPGDTSLSHALSSLAHSPASSTRSSGGGGHDHDEDPETTRIRALVDLARGGDAEAFGQLYDHYVTGIFRFIYYRTSSQQLAEDLTSETFVRALRSIQKFTWQGKDFGAWLTTIARNLITDHFKSSRARLEIVSDSASDDRRTVDSTENDVMSLLTNEMLFEAVNGLPTEQRDCVVMRFIQGLSIAETAQVLERSEGAVKQLQLRAVRALAKVMPEGTR